MLRQFSVKRIVFFFLLDWLGSLLILFCAAWLRGFLGSLPVSMQSILEKMHVQVGGVGGIAGGANSILPWPVLIVVAILWPVLFNFLSVYDGRRNGTLWQELRNVFVAAFFAMLVLAGFLYLTYRETSRGIFLIFFVLDMVFVLDSRLVLGGYRRISTTRRIDQPRNVLIVGAGEVGRNAAREIKRYAWVNIRLTGFLDDNPERLGQFFEDIPIIGRLDQVSEIVPSRHIQDAIVALPIQAYETLVDICEKLQGLGVRVHVIPDLFSLSFPNAALDGFGGIPVIDLGLAGLQGLERFQKRFFDVLVASISLLIASPVLLVLAVLIKLDSPGPVFYRQKRIGENGKPFSMLKFRSMRADADPAIHEAYVTRLIRENLKPDQLGKGQTDLKMKDDLRITRIGHFIRKTSLDELPQLFNVLRGEMSLVGPRPPLPYELEHYQEWHTRRLEALPGMTGLWQVRGRNRVSFDEMVRMDLDYIKHQSILGDILILLQTPWAALFARGAG